VLTEASHAVTHKHIPVFSPHLGIDTLKAVTDAFNVGWIGMGATTAEFENSLKEYLGGDRHVVATMTGTAALHLGLMLAGVGPGDEIILPSFNFIADVQVICWCGATPVFCDIDETTLSLDPVRVSDLLTPRTRAIMPLHFAGIVGHLDDVYSIARQHKLRVVEDATHALGSTCCGRRIGAFGDITCFSFDPVKIMTCLDGGALTCATQEDVQTLQRLRLLGIDTDTALRYKNRRAWDYDVTSVGFRCHMTNINAAIGLSQLAHLNEFIESRRRICSLYNDAFRDLQWLSLTCDDYSTVGPFIYTVRIRDGLRGAVIEHLRGHGIDAGIHFLPCHLKSFCRHMRAGPLPVTERIGREILTLPLWSNMPTSTAHAVIDAMRSFRTLNRRTPPTLASV
jgi:dTDP-4-amino-4,6-dideoxygalactose transaminase